MKPILLILFLSCSMYPNSFAQGYGTSSKKKSKEYDDSKDFKTCIIAGNEIKYKRTPLSALKKHPAKTQIIETEALLEKIRLIAIAGKDTLIPLNYSKYIIIEKIASKPWNTTAYAEEEAFYRTLFKNRILQKEQREKQINDSIKKVKYERELFVKDSIDKINTLIEERNKFVQDSLNYIAKKQKLVGQNFMFLDANDVALRQFPITNGAVIGTVGEGSFVKILQKTNKDWYKVRIMDYEGFLPTKFLVDDIDKMKSESAKKNAQDRLENGGGSSITTEMSTKSNIKTPTNANNSRDCGPAGVTLHRGSKGGCYYLSGNKKVYVDRSCCN